MKSLLTITLTLCCLTLSACSQIPVSTNEPTRVSRDYEAVGDASGIHPFVYGKHTLLEFTNSPFWLSVKDQDGSSISFTKEGRYYSLERVFDYFTVSTGLRSATFKLLPEEKKPAKALPAIAPLPDAREQTQPPQDLAPPPALLQIHEKESDDLDQQAFNLMKLQLAQYRKLLQRAENHQGVTGEELQNLHRKLDGLDKKMATGIAVVHLAFPNRGSRVRKDDKVLEALLPAAMKAQKINIYGRTNAIVAGKNDPEIAEQRARNTRQFLIDHGVDPEKIEITSMAAGDFIAPAYSKEGTALNRRAAVEIINHLP